MKMRRQREKLHAAPEALLREFLHAFRMVFGIALFAFSLTLFVPAVVDKCLDPDKHPCEGRQGESADENVDEQFGDCDYG